MSVGVTIQLALVVVMRIIEGRQRFRRGLRLTPKRRVVVPLAMAVVALIGLSWPAGHKILSAGTMLLVLAAVAALGGVLRACCARISLGTTEDRQPGEVLATDTFLAPVAEVVTLALVGVLTLHALWRNGEENTAATVWMMSVAVLDVARYATHLMRAQPQVIGTAV